MRNFIPKFTRRDIFFLSLTILVYLLLTTVNLTKLPIFVDEALYLRWAQIAWHDASWRFISLTDGKQPLYIWFVIPFMKLIADPLVAGRLASIVAGLGTVFGGWYLGWLIKDKRTAYFTALALMFSPFLFFYYRFGTMESLLTATGIWALNLSILLAKTNRLDMALLLGMVTGLSLLVKSSALFYFLLMPAAYLLVVNRRNLFSRRTAKYLILIAISAILAQAINNIQRLSPWMHMIQQKNAFFVVPYSEIFKNHSRIFNNFHDIFRWHFRYTSIPVVITALFGIGLMLSRSPRLALLLLIWLIGPLTGTALIARLFAPRYISFITPYLLVFSAYFLANLRNKRLLILTCLLTFAIPFFLISKLIFDPIHFPYASVDEGYVNGWSAGNGTKQIAQFFIQQDQRSSQPITVFTEGTFGILPQGLELYTDGLTKHLRIIGLYPLNKIPPQRVLETARSQPTYLILNNTVSDKVPPTMELVAEYPKRDPQYSMRLYRIVLPH